MTNFGNRRRLVAVIGGVCLLGSSIGLPNGAFAAGAGAAKTAEAAFGVGWPMAGFDLQHTNSNPYEKTLGPSTVPHLTEQWSAAIGGPYANTSPVVAAGVRVGSRREDLLYAGNEEGDLVAVNAVTGVVVWRRTLGAETGGASNPACSNSPFGITDSPALQPSTNTLYVVDGLDRLWALDMSTGSTRPRYPIRITTDYVHEHVWSALNLVDGRLYISTASLCDAGMYHGRVIVVSTARAGIVRQFVVNGKKGPIGGGIWGWDGVSFDTTGRHIYLAAGNDTGKRPNAGLADSVIELNTASMGLVARDNPSIPGPDSDFGSTPVLFQARGCPAQLAVENKDGKLYLYDQGHIAAGPVQALQVSTLASQDLIGDVAWSSSEDLLFVGDGAGQSPFVSGVLAFLPVRKGGTCSLKLWWQTPLGPATSLVAPPVFADGVVYYGDGSGNTVTALRATTGQVLWSYDVSAFIATSPVVVNGRLYVVDWNGDVEAFGLARPSRPGSRRRASG